MITEEMGNNDKWVLFRRLLEYLWICLFFADRFPDYLQMIIHDSILSDHNVDHLRNSFRETRKFMLAIIKQLHASNTWK